MTSVFRSCIFVAFLAPMLCSAESAPSFDAIRPLVKQYCFGCHGGEKTKADIDLTADADLRAIFKNRGTWLLALDMMVAGDMPPDDDPQPTQAERDRMIAWLKENVDHFDFAAEKSPGPGMVRRLNRHEYRNTMRDLFGVNLDVAAAVGLTEDQTGEKFDNLAQALDVSPLLMEKYMAAAEKMLDRVVSRDPVREFSGADLETDAGELPEGGNKNVEAVTREDGKLVLRAGEAFQTLPLSRPGRYELRFRVYGLPTHPERRSGRRGMPHVEIRVDDRLVRETEVRKDTAAKYPHHLLSRFDVEDGEAETRIALRLTNPEFDNDRYRGVSIADLRIVGPITTETSQRIDRRAHDRLFFATPDEAGSEEKAARQVIERFATRAFRRPVQETELERLMRLYALATEEGEPFEQAVRLVVRTVLMSPQFLFRIEKDRGDDGEAYPVSEYELASRLSYFLWSTMPDDELFELAEQGKLSDPESLRQQVERMIGDPRAERFAEHFGGQWLGYRDLDNALPDERNFPRFTSAIRNAMREESTLFFTHILRENRPVFDFIDADYAFYNRDLANHYLPTKLYLSVRNDFGKKGQFQKFQLKDEAGRRGGILGQGSFLVQTSHPDRTSPSERGKWVLAKLLGTPPPPPPPNVSNFEDDEETEREPKDFREKMAMHASEPSCANCHKKMDPIGFALENFDAIGRWRDEVSGQALDTSGKLPDGSSFNGVEEFKAVLVERKEQFARHLSEQVLSYALGRELLYYDEFAIRQILERLEKDGHGLQSLVLAVIESYPFTHRENSTADDDNFSS